MEHKYFWQLVLGAVGLIVLVCSGCAEQAIRPDAQTIQQIYNEPYSDRDWAVVLRDNVRYGLVDYQTLRLSPEPLKRYCALLSLTGPGRTPEQFPSKAHATAYYINAFNALVLRAVLLYENPTTMYDLSMPRLEYDYKFALDGGLASLAEIEARILQESNGDVRCLLATSRAAMGTPRLMNEPIRPTTLENQLAAAAAAALDAPEILRVDHSSRSILVWQLINRREDEFVDYWKSRRRVRTAYLFNVLLELASPQRRRALQSAVGYGFRPIAFDRSLNRWEHRTDRPLVP